MLEEESVGSYRVWVFELQGRLGRGDRTSYVVGLRRDGERALDKNEPLGCHPREGGVGCRIG